MALSALFALFLSAQPAHAVIDAQFCNETIASPESLKTYTPRELCEAAGGWPCSTAKNMAQAVCLAANEGMCSFLKSSEDASAVRHLRALCNSQQINNEVVVPLREQSPSVPSLREMNSQSMNLHDYDRTSIYGAEASED